MQRPGRPRGCQRGPPGEARFTARGPRGRGARLRVSAVTAAPAGPLSAPPLAGKSRVFRPFEAFVTSHNKNRGRKAEDERVITHLQLPPLPVSASSSFPLPTDASPGSQVPGRGPGAAGHRLCVTWGASSRPVASPRTRLDPRPGQTTRVAARRLSPHPNSPGGRCGPGQASLRTGGSRGRVTGASAGGASGAEAGCAAGRRPPRAGSADLRRQHPRCARSGVRQPPSTGQCVSGGVSCVLTSGNPPAAVPREIVTARHLVGKLPPHDPVPADGRRAVWPREGARSRNLQHAVPSARGVQAAPHRRRVFKLRFRLTMFLRLPGDHTAPHPKFLLNEHGLE